MTCANLCVVHAGKTLLARAVANRTDACFIRVIGSELVQKYVGEGARMVRELFQMARSKKACLIFFDEVDAIGGARFDDGAGKLCCYFHMLRSAASCFQMVWAWHTHTLAHSLTHSLTHSTDVVFMSQALKASKLSWHRIHVLSLYTTCKYWGKSLLYK